MEKFAVLQLSGCAGCEVSLLNADAWVDKYQLVYMPLVISASGVPEVDILLVSGGVRTDEDLHNLKRSVKKANKVVAVGTCAISGGVTNLGNREEVRNFFMNQSEQRDLPRLLADCRPIADFVKVERYLPGCPPTPELFMAVLFDPPDFKAGNSVCVECNRKKDKTMKPKRLSGHLHGNVQPGICLINQGFLCIGTSTRGGCGALCTNPGQPCVGCRGPSNAFIEKESDAWFASIKKVFSKMTEIPEPEIDSALRSAQMAMFLYQFIDYAGDNPNVPSKKEIL